MTEEIQEKKTNKKYGILLILALALIIVSLTYIAFTGYATKENEETIKVGILLPLSGNAAYYGEASQKGIEIARQEIEEKYPELDIRIYYEDSFYTPIGGVDGYNKLMNINKIDSIITAASQVSLAVQPLSTKNGILQMAVFSSADKYTSPNDLSFRVSTKNEIEASKIAEFIKENNYKKLGIIYLNNDFGVGFKDSLKEELSKNNASVKIVQEEGVLLTDSDFKTQLSKIKESETDIVFMVGIAKQYSLIMKQAREMGINSQFLAMRSAEDPVLLETAGKSAEGLIYTYPFDANSDDSEIKEFTGAFEEKYNEIPDAYAAEGYEGFKLTALAFENCGKDYVCIQEYLEDLENYESTFGNLRFDENGDVYYDYFFKTIKNGQFVPYS